MLIDLTSFPHFGLYGTPLLILYIWGLVFSMLLFVRYWNKRNISDLFLGAVLLAHTFDRTTFTIGFLGWYDAYPNTKINYFLFNVLFILGPLIYLYVRSVVTTNFQWQRKYLWHFMPMIFFLLYRIIIFIYDLNQEGFEQVQDGALWSTLNNKYVGHFSFSLSKLLVAIYLVLSIQLYYNYRKSLNQYYASTEKYQARWLRNFLLIFSTLFLISLIMQEINSSIISLGYTDLFWAHLIAALCLIYLAWFGYVKNNRSGSELEEGIVSNAKTEKASTLTQKNEKSLRALMETEKPFLDPDLNLSKLAKLMNLSSSDLSSLINTHFQLNFNDFINQYRVEEVKAKLEAGQAEQYTLLSIAYSAGFNSKATFNRLFKKFTGSTPSQFQKNRSES